MKNLPLLERTLVIVAHPDDETGGCAALLQRIQHPAVVFATDGAPRDSFFWAGYASRRTYAAVRQVEARRALSLIGVRAIEFPPLQSPRFADQELYRALPEAVERISDLVERYHPSALLTTAYEGGHPDHDACSFISHLIGNLHSIPVWEMPLYHRAADGRLICQQFIQGIGTEWALWPSARELLMKREMLSRYESQLDLSEFASSKIEWFRPQLAYDYTQPPHPGVLNYEAWQWPVNPNEVCRRFELCSEVFAHPEAWARGSSQSLAPLTTVDAAEFVTE